MNILVIVKRFNLWTNGVYYNYGNPIKTDQTLLLCSRLLEITILFIMGLCELNMSQIMCVFIVVHLLIKLHSTVCYGNS